MGQRLYLRKNRRFDTFYENRKKSFLRRHFGLFALTAVLIVVLCGVVLFKVFYQPPDNFPVYQSVDVKSGETLLEVAQKLNNRSFIKSPQVFQWAVMFADGERNVVAGSYYFKEPLTPAGLAERLTTGDFGFTRKKITFPEGSTAEQMGTRLKENLSMFSRERFVELAMSQEGYLFPETYTFFPDVTSEEVIAEMTNTFNAKTQDIRAQVEENPARTFSDVVIMASILEEEGKTTEDRRKMAGVLWKRLREGVPLQVDATFAYFTDKSTFELTSEDLKIDSLYNTYLYKGLPVGPISNPGLDSLTAAITPIETPFFYYLSDPEGNVYYSETLDRHQELKEQHLP